MPDRSEPGQTALIWVPTEAVAQSLAGLDGATVEVQVPDGSPQQSAAEVEFYVPPFFPAPEAVVVMDQMPKLRVVQTLTAGFDRVRPHVPHGAALCNARGVHDASTAEWVVGARSPRCGSSATSRVSKQPDDGATGPPTAWLARRC